MIDTKKFRRAAAAGAIACCLAGAMPAFAGEDPRVAAEVMALARAQWAAEMGERPAAEQMSATADDYTEFNPVYPTRIESKAFAVRMAETEPGEKPLFSDMQNPKVQVYGDTAILTYNFAGINKTKEGKIEPSTAKSTRVYVRQGGKWMLVHANFAPVNAPAN